MLYAVNHITRHIYYSAVSLSLNELRLTPRSLPGQKLRETSLRLEPDPATWQRRQDYFGNDVTTVSIHEPHTQLVIHASSLVDVEAPPTHLPSIAWEQARDQIALPANDDCIEASEYIFNSPFVSSAAELAEFARPTFAPERPLIDALQELSRRIHREFQYLPMSTSIETPLLEVLRNRKGVCQDFAHLMIGVLRSLRLPARYISGYLRSTPGNQGAEASHAWVSAFVPGFGWLSFDPTNDVMPSDDHVVVAWGRDYGDVTPVRGLAVGGGSHEVHVDVSVQPVGST